MSSWSLRFLWSPSLLCIPGLLCASLVCCVSYALSRSPIYAYLYVSVVHVFAWSPTCAYNACMVFSIYARYPMPSWCLGFLCLPGVSCACYIAMPIWSTRYGLLSPVYLCLFGYVVCHTLSDSPIST